MAVVRNCSLSAFQATCMRRPQTMKMKGCAWWEEADPSLECLLKLTITTAGSSSIIEKLYKAQWSPTANCGEYVSSNSVQFLVGPIWICSSARLFICESVCSFSILPFHHLDVYILESFSVINLAVLMTDVNTCPSLRTCPSVHAGGVSSGSVSGLPSVTSETMYQSDRLYRNVDMQLLCKDSIYNKTLSWLRNLKPWSKSRYSSTSQLASGSRHSDNSRFLDTSSTSSSAASRASLQPQTRNCSTLPRDAKLGKQIPCYHLHQIVPLTKKGYIRNEFFSCQQAPHFQAPHSQLLENNI